MSLSVEHLPWRLAALAGLLVGAVCMAASVDIWVSLLRVGAAFALFGLGGWALRAVLRQGRAAPGARIDQMTPPMSVEDVSRPASDIARQRDESEK